MIRITGTTMNGLGIFFTLTIACVIGLLNGCALPTMETRSVTYSISADETRSTKLGKGIAPRARTFPGKTGIYLLGDPHDAFAARVLLAHAAERALDIQGYIWRDDVTGMLLLNALHDAAERGVRVRLLLDDNGTTGLDSYLAALDSHSNIEVRLFNPFVVRKPKALGFVTNFKRANRRMHNKSFTADNQATIIGGRNIGDEYFGATEGVLFADLDVLAVGPIVEDVSTDFDRYWASESAYPAELILPAADATHRAAFAAAAERMRGQPRAAAYVQNIQQSRFIQDLIEGRLALEWGKTRMVSDDPAKGLGTASANDMLTHQLSQILDTPTRNVELISPYFVPTAAGVNAFTALAQSGVKVRALTNSLEATDVAAVHAGYAKRRKALLEAGIVLYELRRLSENQEQAPEWHIGSGRFGSSGSSLHAKTFSVDGARFFVGSFNFDPRSAHLNTELGFVVDSPSLARLIEQAFDESIPMDSYEVRLGEDGELYWLEQRDGQEIRHDTEPGTGFWQRLGVKFLSILPIEWLL